MTINELCQTAHSDAVAKGWYDDGDRNFGELLMLIVSELGECLEAHRGGKECRANMDTVANRPHGSFVGDDDWHTFFHSMVKDTYADELCDAVIRIADMCGYLGIDLENHIKAKLAYNRTRPHKHGKAY